MRSCDTAMLSDNVKFNTLKCFSVIMAMAVINNTVFQKEKRYIVHTAAYIRLSGFRFPVFGKR